MGKVVNLFNKSSGESWQSETAAEELEKIEQQYKEYYADENPEESNPAMEFVDFIKK